MLRVASFGEVLRVASFGEVLRIANFGDVLRGVSFTPGARQAQRLARWASWMIS